MLHDDDLCDSPLQPARPLHVMNASNVELKQQSPTPPESTPSLLSEDSAVETLTTAEKIARRLKMKDHESVAMQRPLQLLNLPIDVLREIIKEITHTNDLTSLALTHPSLHDLVIPFIYSRFDIVWPDTSATSDSRTGVDALTYGLSTLVMSFDVFGGLPSQRNRQPRTGRSLGSIFSRRRAGNDYAKWTRKFSLGNGPAEWVSEYLISKESGKMLGTLVALAIARMERLESFVWDMPTGIVRDVWDALSYLGESQEEGNARLQSIWIRCHDSKSTNSPSSHDAPLHQTQIIIPSHPHGHSHPLPMPSSAPLNTSSNGRDYLAESYRKIEHPNFSILSAMQSITVLEIDEPAYLEELSILVERSAETLRTLRIGAATIWHPRSWATPDTETPSTSTPVVSSMSYLTSGGMLGMVMSKLYDCRKQTRPIVDLSQEEGNPTKHPDEPEPEGIAVPIVPANIALPLSPPMSADSDRNTLEVDHTVVSPTDLSHHDDIPLPPLNVPLETFNNQTLTSEPVAKLPFRNPLNSPTSNHSSAEHLKGRHLSRSKPFDRSNRRKLKLQTLELEKVPLSIQVMQKTIDMRCLTSLTLLNCESDEELWKTLRRTYCPRPNYSASSGDLISAGSEYYLNLKRIHTNNVSSALIGFLKETLAPNTLEWLFLQDRDTPGSKVKIDQIYRGPLRRHRASLKKLMIDSGEKSRIEGSRSRSNTKWEKWVFNREVLAFVTGGKMTSLRELAMSVEYKDWHFFLQQLPNIPHLRSLYIPHVKDHVHGHQSDARELAMQVVDIIALKPEIELCYMGILTKCFEVLERKYSDSTPGYFESSTSSSSTSEWQHVASNMNHEDSDDTESEDQEDDDTADGDNQADSDVGDESDAESDGSRSEFDEGSRNPRLKLREILFYTEKVEIFKARHGAL